MIQITVYFLSLLSIITGQLGPDYNPAFNDDKIMLYLVIIFVIIIIGIIVKIVRRKVKTP